MGGSTSTLNFGAGPAKLPRQVLEEVQAELLNYGGTGMSIVEMSHRSKEYMNINQEAQSYVYELLNVPKNYKVLFLQGGGAGAFAAVAMNLMGRTGCADYMVTGTWSKKAMKEAKKYGEINLVFPEPPLGTIPNKFEWKFNENASYVYYCANETVDGVEFDSIPELPYDIPLVSDMSSNIMTKQFDVSKFGCIFAGAQKNIGPAGVTVVIIREDLLGNPMKMCPSIMDFTHISNEKSIHNTPAVFSVYVMNKVFAWIKKHGGVKEMERLAKQKSELLYKTIAESGGFYTSPIAEDCRSRMNVPFRVGKNTETNQPGNEELEQKFLEHAENNKMFQLKGHRSVGGIRASLYNAVGLDDVESLVKYMKAFQKEVEK